MGQFISKLILKEVNEHRVRQNEIKWNDRVQKSLLNKKKLEEERRRKKQQETDGTERTKKSEVSSVYIKQQPFNEPKSHEFFEAIK